MISICGMLKETGYFFKGYVKTRASRPVIQNAIGFMTGVALAAKKTLAGISEAISGEASPEQLRKFLDNRHTRKQPRRLMDDKAVALFLTAVKRNKNCLHPVYLIIDATYMGRHSKVMEDLFFVGKGAHKVGNHIFVVGLLVLHDGTRIPLRPRLQKAKKTAGKPYQTPVEIAADMVQSASFRQGLIVVADSYYLCNKVTDKILEMKHHFVIAAKSNRVVVEGRLKRQLQDYVVDENILCRLRTLFSRTGRFDLRMWPSCCQNAT